MGKRLRSADGPRHRLPASSHTRSDQRSRRPGGRRATGDAPTVVPWRALHACCADHRVLGPEVLDVVDLPDPVTGDGEQLFEVSTAGIDYADTHQRWASSMASRWSVSR